MSRTLAASSLVVVGLAACGPGGQAQRPRIVGNSTLAPGTATMPPPPATASKAATEIARLAETGATAPWDERVQAIVLGAFDRDRSGAIDRTAEVRAITCDVWRALDEGVVGGQYQAGFAIIYGLPTDKGWVGYVVGFDESMRPVLADQAARCGLDIGSDPALTGYDPSVDYDAAAAALRAPKVSAPAGNNPTLANLIAGLQAPGTDPWDQAVRTLLLGAFDQNHSGGLDNDRELGAITCDVWRALDANLSTHVRALYGFLDGYNWVGDALGFEERMRALADAYAAACGLP
jgi:hypothetical protein